MLKSILEYTTPVHAALFGHFLTCIHQICIEQQQCPRWEVILAIGAFADNRKRAKQVMDSHKCISVLYRGILSTECKDRVACAWALGIILHRCPAVDARNFVFQPEILNALASEAVHVHVSGTGAEKRTEERMAVMIGETDPPILYDSATDAEVWERCRSCVKLAVSMDDAGAAVLVVQRDSAAALKLKVSTPRVDQHPRDHKCSSFWSKLCIRFAARLVPDMPTDALDRSLDQLVAAGYYGRAGIQRCLVNISMFPHLPDFQVPKVSTRKLKRRQQQKLQTKVR